MYCASPRRKNAKLVKSAHIPHRLYALENEVKGIIDKLDLYSIRLIVAHAIITMIMN